MNQILFVTCVDDETLSQECLNHIRQLTLPPGFQAEVVQLRGATSLAQGYNNAMKASGAKYKVYLHQDTFIINRNFIPDLLALFQHHPTLGLLGMVGCRQLPPTGVWWEGLSCEGKVLTYVNTFYLLNFSDGQMPFSPVAAVDGLLIATQYDLPWREDLFDGFHFYDTSQSQEFIKKGYLVGVPCQKEPWCLHFSGANPNISTYDHYRRIFLKNYPVGNKNALPLIPLE
ncbi:MAG: glycosyltransferase family protein [Heliobacteriaceae bacterium]|nr:glycosyltransferase family protein [Heliobacteriaceae bacterium]MDD4587589.1 glycosyltransferase family protein [Heliobacteriaceae bacterium]